MSYAAPVIHYTFDTDGTNTGTLGASDNATIPIQANVESYSQLSTIDTVNKIEGVASISVGIRAKNADSFPKFVFNTGDAWTISFWARMNASTRASREIFSMLSATSNIEIESYNSRDNLGVEGTVMYRNSNSQYLGYNNTVFGDGNWYHYVITGKKVYFENQLKLTMDGFNFSNNEDVNFILGAAYWIDTGAADPSYEGGMDGNFDNVRVYNYEADTTFIDYLYKIGSDTNVASLSGASVSDLQNAGATLSQLIAAGVSLADLIAGGVSIADLIAAGVSIADLIAGGVTQIEIDIVLTQIKIHTAFTISDGTNDSVFAENEVYTPTTFATKLTTNLVGNTVTVDGDTNLLDSTSGYRLYLQFANAATLTGVPKYIFNIPFSDFSVKAGGQVNLRNVNLDAEMTINTSYVQHLPFGQFAGSVPNNSYDYTQLSEDGNIMAFSDRAANCPYDGGLTANGQSQNGGNGSIEVYQRDSNAASGWTQIGETIYGDGGGCDYGQTVMLSRDGQIVGAGSHRNPVNWGGTIYNVPVHDPTYHLKGYLRFWKRDASSTIDPVGWVPYGNAIVGKTHQDRGFYLELSGDSNSIIVKPRSRVNYLEVFKYSLPGQTGGTWEVQGDTFDGSTNDEEDNYYTNYAISYDGNIIAIGNAYFNRPTADDGRVQIFQRDTNAATGWTQLGNDIVGTGGERFGAIIKLCNNGEKLAVLSSKYSNAGGFILGRVSVYKRDTNVALGWSLIGSPIENPDPHPTISTEKPFNFMDISDDGNKVVISISNYDDNSITSAGRLYVYEYNTSTLAWEHIVTNNQSGSTEPITGTISNQSLGLRANISTEGYTVSTYSSGSYYTYQLPEDVIIANTSTLPTNNYFINNFVSTIETDLVNFTLSYDEPNKRITLDGLAQDISMSITSTDTTIFDTTVTEITQGANTLPFITYGQPDPTFSQYNANGITVNEFLAGGYTIPQLYKGGLIPDWTLDTDANHFNQSYVKDFIDISGSLALRENANLTVNGNIETKGNITIKNPTMAADLSLNHNMFVIGDVSMNGNVTVGDISMNGKVVDCSFTDSSIPEDTFVNLPLPDYTQPTILYEKGFETSYDVSMNANVQINKLKVDGNIEFSDGTTMDTYDENLDYMNINQQYSILNKPVTNIPHALSPNTIGTGELLYGAMKISSDGSIICVQLGLTSPNQTNSAVNYNYTGFGLVISRDSGATWNLTKMPDASDGHVAKDNSHHGFNMSRDGKHMICLTGRILNKPDVHQYVWFSHDYGVTWTQGIISPTTNSSRISTGSCISDDGEHMYLNSYEEYKIHQSHDSGSTWTSTSSGGRSSYYAPMICSSDGQKIAFGTGSNNIWYSINYGTTFVGKNLGGNSAGIVSNADFTKMTLLTSTYNRVWQCDGDFTDTNNWTDLNPFDSTNNYRPQIGGVASPNYKYIMLHTESNGAKRTVSDDYGATWSNVDLPDSGRTNKFSMAISDTGKFFYLDSGLQHINMINLPPFKASTFTSLTINNTLTAGSFSTASDYRIKTDISQLDETVTLDNLRPVKYLHTLINKPQYGLIAHELQEYYPDLVVGEKDGEEWQRVNYTGLVALLINEIKQLKRELTELENGM